jgi:hypothetical protein
MNTCYLVTIVQGRDVIIPKEYKVMTFFSSLNGHQGTSWELN